MSLINIETDRERQNKNALVNSMSFSSMEQVPIDRYEEYLTLGNKSKNSSSDVRNLFDDSNKEDRNWLRIAKKFLMRPIKS
jgi:hypothetical protein